MHIVVKTTPVELERARRWWQGLETQWKIAYNEAVFGKGPVLAPPHDDELMVLLVKADVLRFAGPSAFHPNVSMPLTNLSGLVPLYHLTYLCVSNMQISQVTELTRFTQLRHLFIHDNRIESLQGIEGMIHLESLYAQGNQLTSLTPLRGLTQLKTLYVSRNNLSALDGLTATHAQHGLRLYAQPNDRLPDREIIRVQNELGILCRQG